MRVYELSADNDARQSFYGKARVIQEDNGDLTLQSYSTKVAKIASGVAEVYSTYSATTLRHIKEFLVQEGFKADNKKQIEQDYIKKES